MSSIYERNGVWYVRVAFKKPDGTREILRKSTGYQDKKTAENRREVIARQMIEEAKGAASGIPPIKLSDAIQRFLSSRRDKSRATITTYRNIAKKVTGDIEAKLFAIDPDTYLHQIKTRDLEEYAAHRNREGLKPASIALELKFIFAVHNHAKKLEFQVNPNLVVSPPRPKAKTRTFTDAEIRSILEQARALDPRMADLFIMLMETGCRVSEIIRSQAGDYDTDNRRLTVYRSKTDSRTDLYLSDDALSIFAKYHDKDEPFSGFTNTVRDLRKIINAVCNTPAKSNLTARDGRATLHTTRHTFATRAARAGHDLHALAKVLGHTTPTMTAKYSHLSSLDSSRAITEKKAQTEHSKLYDMTNFTITH